MAKIRHKTFEMYELCDEAALALTPKSAQHVTGTTSLESLTLECLTASRTAGVTHVKFTGTLAFGEENASELRTDFTQLADKLDRNSKVLLDFDGVESFCAASINELEKFNRQLRTKGSRIALCCLGDVVKETFFVRSSV